MALTTAAFDDDPQPPRNLRADDAAQAPYASGSATRMDREAGSANVASQYTSSDWGASAIGQAFCDGDHQWTGTAGKQAGATINNQGSGFPGLADEPSRG
jgi:hypothetical protein